MREILFRGKLIDGAGWVYGDFVHDKKPDGTYDAYIMGATATDVLKEGYPVIPETVGQYTGLKDRNGKIIFEGDLLEFNKDEGVHYEVFYHDYECRYKCSRCHYKGSRCGGYIPSFESGEFAIIGNIHDNKELLK